MVSQGSYSELSKSGVDFSKLLKPSEEDGKAREDSLDDQMNSESTDSGVPLSDTRRPKTDSLTSEGSVGVEYVVTSLNTSWVLFLK